MSFPTIVDAFKSRFIIYFKKLKKFMLDQNKRVKLSVNQKFGEHLVEDFTADYKLSFYTIDRSASK